MENGKCMLVRGEPFLLDASLTTLGTSKCAGLDYKDLPKDVAPGDTLLLNDGLQELKVTKVEGSVISTVVVQGGELGSNKGINKKGGGLSAPALTEKDMEDLKHAIDLHCDFIALSFPKNKADVDVAREKIDAYLEEKGRKGEIVGIISKIERTEAITNLDEIICASEGIMVARGDLGVEIGQAAVPRLQKHMIRRAKELGKFVITATQMMESMITNPVPTRAEVYKQFPFYT
jgi:pyruvate kinase